MHPDPPAAVPAAGPAPGAAAARDAGAARTAALLAAHVPLSLLLDLADPAGPHSRDLLRDEPACTRWLRR